MTETLRTGEAHVWYLWPDRVTSPARLRAHERILSEDERIRNASFRFEQDRHSHLLTRAFVRTLLAGYADVEPCEWQFARDHYGKPQISGPYGAPPITFSISHTAGLIACLFALDTSLGIDTENLQRSLDFLQIAQAHFSPTEYSALCQLPDSDRHRRFFEYWTLKESYAKALGLGMSLNLSEFTFNVEGESSRISFDTGDTRDPAWWQFRLLRPSPHHIVATAIRYAANLKINLEVRDGTPLMQ